ncbi:hypothetical protein GW750_01945 [bacterium]|nr:hypothetical protein [bacterium]
MTTHKTQSDYKNDPRYNEKFAKLDKNLYELEERYDKKAYEAEEGAEKAQSWLQSKWKGIQAEYHDMMAYLNEKFDSDDYEDIMEHRIKAAQKRIEKA